LAYWHLLLWHLHHTLVAVILFGHRSWFRYSRGKGKRNFIGFLKSKENARE
jgi:hypothetical protein